MLRMHFASKNNSTELICLTWLIYSGIFINQTFLHTASFYPPEPSLDGLYQLDLSVTLFMLHL